MDNIKQYLLYFILCPFVFLSFIFEPLTSDVRIYLGTEKLARLAGTFPTNLDTFWEVKPVGSRFIFYVIDSINPFSGWLYQIFTKLVFGVMAILILYYFAQHVSKRWKLDFVYPFVISFLGVFAIANFVILESECFSVLLCLLVVSLLLEDNKWCWRIAGFLLIPLILIKGISLLMIFQILPIWILLESVFNDPVRGDLLSKQVHAGQGFIIALLLYAVLSVTIFPNSIPDALLSAGTTFSSLIPSWITRISYFFNYSAGLVAFTPLIVVGAIALIFVILYTPPQKSNDLKLLISVWIPPVIILFVLSEFFYYQYYPMVLAAIITILYLIKIVDKPEKWFFMMVIITVMLFCIFTAGWSYGMSLKGYAYWDGVDKTAAAMERSFNISNEPSVLYFEALGSYYYFSAPSACRYTIPLPLQRDVPGHSMQQYPAYWDDLACTMNYTGRYIISDDPWFNWSVPGTHAIVKEKFDKEYVKVWNDTWQVYERKPNTHTVVQ